MCVIAIPVVTALANFEQLFAKILARVMPLERGCVLDLPAQMRGRLT